MRLLYEKRHDTIASLALEFEVSRRTIQRDIDILSVNEPIYTMPGRYTGGIFVIDGCYGGRRYFTETEREVLNEVIEESDDGKLSMSDDDAAVLKNIIYKFSRH